MKILSHYRNSGKILFGKKGPLSTVNSVAMNESFSVRRQRAKQCQPAVIGLFSRLKFC